VIAPESRPRLAAKARLRYDRQGGRYLLLYPERGLALNGTAVEVVRLLTGEHTLEGIVARLRARYPAAPPGTIEGEVRAFIASLADRGLLEPAAEVRPRASSDGSPCAGGSTCAAPAP
jgi:coenzyme PQQ biosynthesis protein PqqD